MYCSWKSFDCKQPFFSQITFYIVVLSFKNISIIMLYSLLSVRHCGVKSTKKWTPTLKGIKVARICLFISDPKKKTHRAHVNSALLSQTETKMQNQNKVTFWRVFLFRAERFVLTSCITKITTPIHLTVWPQEVKVFLLQAD